VHPIEKYNAHASEYTALTYRDPDAYFRHRLEILLGLGPRLAPGDRIVELGCADGRFASLLINAGFEYTGVDLSEPMVDVARERVGEPGRFEVGNLLTWAPEAPVAMTACFRSSHFVSDRVSWFRHLGSFTEKKVVFDISPRRVPLAVLRGELAAAGFTRMDVHPFFQSSRRTTPAPVAAALRMLERTGPLAEALLRLRFVAIVAASRRRASSSSVRQ
jgi:SAM-dependent methyltransferase